MATYEQLKAQAIAAYKAGDDEKAEQIASMLKQAKATGAFTNINGVSHLTATLPKKKERSIGEKIVGAGETALSLATGATGGMLGGVVGQGAAATEQLKRRVMDQPLMTERQFEQYAAEPAQALTYAPRTEAGQEYLGAIGKEAAVLQYMNPMLAETAAIANLAKAARPQATVITAPARQSAGKVAQAIPTPKLSPTIAPEALEGAQAAEKLGINVMATDISKPQTFTGKAAQAFTERTPLGTGGMRETQQAQRIEAIKNVAQEYKADSPLPMLEKSVLDDLAKTRGAEVKKYADMKKEVFDRTSGVPMETSNTMMAIDSQIAKMQDLKSSELQPAISYLEDLKQSIGGQDIKNVEELRKLLGDKFKSQDLASVRGVGDKAVSEIYGAIKKDMEIHITQYGDRRDVTKWNVANKKLSIMMNELENNSLKYTLKKGDVSPETITKMLYSKKPSDVQLLYKNLSPEGRANARSAILGKAYQDSLSPDGQISTAKFSTSLGKLGDNEAVFFKGDNAVALDGLKKALALTRRAEEAQLTTASGQQLYSMAMGGAAGIAGGLPGLFGLGAIGLIARVYESRALKGALIKMSKAKTRAEQTAAMEKIGEAVNIGERIDPATMKQTAGYMVDKFARSAEEDMAKMAGGGTPPQKIYKTIDGKEYKVDSSVSVFGKGGYIYKDKLDRFFDTETVKQIKKEMALIARGKNKQLKEATKTELEKTADKVTKVLGKPFRISEHKSKPSSYYYEVDGDVIRISDHDLPFSHEKAMQGINRGENFIRDFVLKKGADNSEVLQEISDFIGINIQ